MTALELDLSGSSLSVWTYKEGLLSRVAHDLCIRADELSAPLRWEGEQGEVDLRVPVRGLRVAGQVDRNGAVTPLSDANHGEIEANMLGPKVLAADQHPEVRFTGRVTRRSEAAILDVEGELTIRSARRPMRFSAALRMEPNGSQVCEGEVRLEQSAFGIRPFKAMLGALKVKDGIRVSWVLRYRPPV